MCRQWQGPGKAFVSLDVANAFGAVQWTDALEAVLDRAQSLAPALAAQWAPRAITLSTQQRGGAGLPFLVFGGYLTPTRIEQFNGFLWGMLWIFLMSGINNAATCASHLGEFTRRRGSILEYLSLRTAGQPMRMNYV